MTTRVDFTSQCLAGAVLLALSAGLALAQVRQIQMGGGMDANPGVGTGGSNRPVQGYVPINGNDIMTGNVSGLAYFHGRVGTSSPYQFQGNLGSSSLANFARQSAGTPYGGTYTGVTTTYYLPSSTVSTAQGALYSAPVGSGFDSGLVPRSSVSPVATSAQLSALNGGMGGDYQAINRMLPAAPLEAGAPGAVLSSPLFVLRTTELPAPRLDVAQPTTLPNGAPGPGMPSQSGGPATMPVNPDMLQGMVGGGEDARVVSQTDEYKMAMVGDIYLKLADELKAAKGTLSGENKEPGAAANGLTNPSLTGGAGMEIDPLTGKPRMMATLPPITGRGGPGAATQGARTGSPAAPLAKRLTEMTDAELLAGSKVKPVKMAPAEAPGGSVSGFDMMMVRAEKNLKEGKFLDAAESYQAALALKPEDPLALVGRAHAEMAAGIYTSAEFDLKFVYTRKPEMMALKYDVGSFIPAARQEFLLEDLQKLAAKKETAGMASFLYCYLCYETGRNTALQAQLQAWAAQEGHDDWQMVAARAWAPK